MGYLVSKGVDNARKPRHFLANVPCHIISRGNNHNVCFFADDEYIFYLKCLNDACLKYAVSVHAYVLMTKHIHLLMTSSELMSIPKIMQSVGRRYVQYINKTYRRICTLWEGRYKASIIDAEAYLLACCRYIELNPVRASMVEHPIDYPWSSYRVNAGKITRHQLVMHDIYVVWVMTIALVIMPIVSCFQSI
jgi:putative transposase